jgi:hypothetical protein
VAKSGTASKYQRISRETAIESIRAPPHTLDEHHEHLLSIPLDTSINCEDDTHFGVFSSQNDPIFTEDEQIFPAADDLYLGDLANELAQELGDGWGSPQLAVNQQM